VETLRVGMAQALAAKTPVMIEAQALGSCVGIALYDPHACVGGIAHAMLPDVLDARRSSRGNLERFVSTGIDELIKKMEDLGAKKKFMTAKIAGGANMFPNITFRAATPIGSRNITSARNKLAELGIPIEAEETGGSFGRTIILDTVSGKLKVRRATSEEKEI